MIANKCEPGDRTCQNVRRYYQADFKKPSPYDKVKEGVKTVKDVTKGIQETAKEVKQTLDTAKDVIKTLVTILSTT